MNQWDEAGKANRKYRDRQRAARKPDLRNLLLYLSSFACGTENCYWTIHTGKWSCRRRKQEYSKYGNNQNQHTYDEVSFFHIDSVRDAIGSGQVG
jgi:hypothetical protein